MNLNINEIKNQFDIFSKEYIDSEDYNEYLYNYFDKNVDNHSFLQLHCDVVSKYGLGYGEKAFRYLWLLLLSQQTDSFKFLEIGVYKGSILALVQLISNELNITSQIFGVTPLNATGDKYSVYTNDDYEHSISYLYHLLNITIENTTIIEGLSTDPIVKDEVSKNGPFNIVYVDGGHNYDTVISDLKLVEDLIVTGGFLVLDDASSFMNFKKNHVGFIGHMDVGLAIRDYLDDNLKFDYTFTCGHNRVWRRK
jgi:hypothetical protein